MVVNRHVLSKALALGKGNEVGEDEGDRAKVPNLFIAQSSLSQC
jgi:hypothetical protein